MNSITDKLWGKPSYDIKAHVRHVQGLFDKYPLNTKDKIEAHLQRTMNIIFEGIEAPPWYRQVADCAAAILSKDGIYRFKFQPKEDREWLETEERRLSERRIEVAQAMVGEFFQKLIVQLPVQVFLEHTHPIAMVPMHTVVKDMPFLMTAALNFFTAAYKDDYTTFPTLYYELEENLKRCSGIRDDKSTKPVVWPAEYKGDPLDYLVGTPLWDFFQTPVPFVIPRKAFGEHGAVFGKSGHGKTRTLRAVLANFFHEPDPPALFIMDSLGSLIEGIPELEIFSTRLKDRLVVLDPPSLNFFQLESDDLCFYLFKAIDQSFTSRQATMISYLMEFMRNVPDANLLSLIQVCEAKDNPHPEILDKLSPYAQSFFANQFYAKKPDALVQQTKGQIASRIYTLARMPKFDAIFSGKGGTPFDAFRCIQEKKICLINTDARPTKLGGLGEASGILGRFILALLLEAAQSRPKDERHLALIVCDECKAYMDDHAAKILSDARQFGMGMLLATQFPHQLDEGVRREINTNTSIKLMGPVEYAVASQYARDMFTTPEFIMSMKSHDHSHAEWATYVANTTDRAIKLSVPLGTIEAMPKRPRMSKEVQSYFDDVGEDAPDLPQPAADKQQRNELSLRDTDLPLPTKKPPQSGPSPTKASPETIAQPSDIDLAITTARRIETLLEKHYSAVGRGLHEKLTSVEAQLPPTFVHHARYIASTRNNLVHVDGSSITDRQLFLKYAEDIEGHFAAIEARSTSEGVKPGKGRF